MAHRVRLPKDVVSALVEQAPRVVTHGEGNRGVEGTVSHEDGYGRARGVSLGGEGFVKRQVGGEGHDAGEPRGMPQAFVEGDGATLGEPGEHHVVLAHPALLLPGDERAHLRRRLANAPGVLRHAPVEGQDVVPRAHGEATVDGDGPDVGVGEHEAHREASGQA